MVCLIVLAVITGPYSRSDGDLCGRRASCVRGGKKIKKMTPSTILVTAADCELTLTLATVQDREMRKCSAGYKIDFLLLRTRF